MAYSFKRPLLQSIGFLSSMNQKYLFTVIHLGTVRILCPFGDGISGAVEEIFENCRQKLKRKQLPERRLQIKEGAFELLSDENEGKVIRFSRIIYCGVDDRRKKIFVFNYHQADDKGRRTFQTHALLCESKAVAKRLALVVGEYFRGLSRPGEEQIERIGMGKRQAGKRSETAMEK